MNMDVLTKYLLSQDGPGSAWMWDLEVGGVGKLWGIVTDLFTPVINLPCKWLQQHIGN